MNHIIITLLKYLSFNINYFILLILLLLQSLYYYYYYFDIYILYIYIYIYIYIIYNVYCNAFTGPHRTSWPSRYHRPHGNTCKLWSCFCILLYSSTCFILSVNGATSIGSGPTLTSTDLHWLRLFFLFRVTTDSPAKPAPLAPPEKRSGYFPPSE